MDNLAMLIFRLALYIIIAAMALAFVRLLKGPTYADRAVALDGMTISGISVIVFIAMFMGRAIYLDVAIVYGLLSFLSVVAVARYIEGGL